MGRRQNCPHCDTSHKFSAFPEIEERFNENPAQWLSACRDDKTSRTAAALIRGVCDIGRVNAWLKVEREFFGARDGRGHKTQGPFLYLRARRAVLVDDVADVDESLFNRVATRAERERLGHLVGSAGEPSVETEPEPVEDVSASESSPQPAVADGGHDRDAEDLAGPEYEAALDEVRSIVESFATVAEVESHLERERDGPERAHVVAALEDRLEELRDGAGSQEVTA
jgi:hypothetical protein